MSEPLPHHMHVCISCNTSMEIDGWITYIQSVPKRFKIIFMRFGYSGRFLAKSGQKCPECPKMSKSIQSVQKCPELPNLKKSFWDTCSCMK